MYCIGQLGHGRKHIRTEFVRCELRTTSACMIVNTENLVECVTIYSLSSRLRFLEFSPGVARIRPDLEVST
jgi:hypothetical protein